ncbi:MAG: NAD-binding protein, partial [Anaerolineales bacterium]
MTLSETNVTIVGLGLMGGSLALALREKCAGLTGVDSDPATLELARRRKVVGFVTGDFMAGVARADLLVLAT